LLGLHQHFPIFGGILFLAASFDQFGFCFKEDFDGQMYTGL